MAQSCSPDTGRMAGTYADASLCLPELAVDHCRRFNLSTSWVGRANRFTNPLGVRSGMGAVLLTRAALDDIDLTTPHDLVLRVGGDRVRVRNLHIGDTTCLTPSAPGSKNAIHLVPLFDRRNLFRLTSLNRGFNMRLTPLAPYTTNTTNAGTAYTWSQVWAILWQVLIDNVDGMPAGVPALPEEPQGTPENFHFFGVSAADAIERFLARAGFELAWDHEADTYSVVAVGADQANLAKHLAEAQRARLYDLEPVTTPYGAVPASVTVLFPKLPPRAYSNTTVYPVSSTDDDAIAGQTGTQILADDLPAEYQGRNLVTDTADLQARADARAARYFEAQRAYYTEPFTRVYAGLWPKFRTGAMVGELTWSDCLGASDGDTDGWTTEVVRPRVRNPQETWPGNSEANWRPVEVVVTREAEDTGAPTGYHYGEVWRWDAANNIWESLFKCWFLDTTGTGSTHAYGMYPSATFQGVKADDNGDNLRPVYAGGCCPFAEPIPLCEVDSDGNYIDDTDDCDITVDCCAVGVKRYLTATVSAPSCSCLDGSSVRIEYSEAFQYWSGGFSNVCAGSGVSIDNGIRLDCFGGSWRLQVITESVSYGSPSSGNACWLNAGTLTLDSTVCEPLALTFSGTIDGNNTAPYTCSCIGQSFTLTITE